VTAPATAEATMEPEMRIEAAIADEKRNQRSPHGGEFAQLLQNL
jgi:hypothetical protein